MIKFKDILKESQDEYELQGKYNWHGLIIDIENKKGTYRQGKDPDGSTWKTYMNADYGRIRNTKTKADKEEVDVYVYSKNDSEFVYQIKQMKAPEFKDFDEYKYIINCPDKKSAIELYLKQYDDKKFYGGAVEIPSDNFISQIKSYMVEKHKN